MTESRSPNPASGVRRLASAVCLPIPGFRFARRPGWDFDIVRAGTNAPGLAGVYLAEDGGERVDIQALMALLGNARRVDAGTEKQTPNIEHPTSNAQCRMSDNSNFQSEIRNQKSTILRAARNYVWSARAPWNIERAIVIKEFKPRGVFRRLLDCGRPDKAVRSWNGAQELLRRGLCSPTPLACLVPEKTAPGNALIRQTPQLSHACNVGGALCAATVAAHSTPPTKIVRPRRIRQWRKIPMHGFCATSYYICEAFAPAWSVRDAFNAFSAGAAEFQGQTTNDWYEAIAVFLQNLHTRGVFFRDLSAGNLLVRSVSVPHPPSSVVCPPSSVLPGTPAGELEFALIDTARARFYPHSLGLRLRLCDLMRICHPLFWPGRRVFMEKYLAHNGRRFRWWMKIPFWYYDGKHLVKNALKKIGL